MIKKRSRIAFLFGSFLAALLVFAPADSFARRAVKKSKRIARHGHKLKTTQIKRDHIKLLGKIELRPTWHTKDENSFTTQNKVELGVQINRNTKLLYAQHINTQTSIDDYGNESSFDPYLHDGVIKLLLDNIWTIPRDKFALHYEGNVVLPIHTAKRDAGLIFILKNSLEFQRQLSPTLSFSFAERPNFHFYKEAEDRMAADGPAANPAFENAIELKFAVQLSESVSFGIPMNLSFTKYRTSEMDATMSGEWDYFLNFEPGLTFAVAEHVSLGVVYKTDNLIGKYEDGGKGLTTGSTIDTGVFQIKLGLSL